jgi:hypothetical protein
MQEIQISIEKGKQTSKSTNNKLFVITVYLKIGTITIQGNDFQNMSSNGISSLLGGILREVILRMQQIVKSQSKSASFMENWGNP